MTAARENEARRLVRLYRALGWRIVRAGENKRPLGPWKKLRERAPSDDEWRELEDWAAGEGDLFLITGTGSGVAVLDLDAEAVVADCRARLGDAWELLPRATSPSRGVHVYASTGDRGAVKSRADKGRWDFQADGKGVILPSGRPDRLWQVEPTLDQSPDLGLLEPLLAGPDGGSVAPLPGATPVVDGARPTEPFDWDPVDHDAVDRGLRQGARDQELFRLAKSLRSRRVPRADAEEQMRAAWEKIEQPAGDELPWEIALEKLERVYQETPPGYSEEFEQAVAGRSEEFFDGKRFAVERLAAHLAEDAPVATFAGRLYTYRAGLYRPEGEADIRRRILAALPDRWQVNYRNSTIEYLLDGAPELLEHPPLHVVNVRNGLLDVRTRELTPHTPEHLSLVQIGAWYDPDAGCPLFDRYLEQVLPDPDVRLLFLEVAGLLLVPDMSMQKAVMLLGQGGTGKSVALGVLVALLGRENCSAVELQALGTDRFIGSRLVGRLANICGDLDAKTVESSGLFKSLTGGDAITAQEKYKQPFEFKPFCRLVFSANTTPPTKDASSAYFERFLVLPFDQKFRGAETEDRALGAKLTTRAELSGLLNHALDGLDRIRAQGFTPSAAAATASDRFRQDADTVAGFLVEMVDTTTDSQVTRQEMYAAYRRWCQDGGQYPVARRNFTGRLRALLEAQRSPITEGKARHGKHSVRVWRNATLRQRP